MAGLPPDMPVVRVPDECSYYKEDAGKLMLGAFEPVAKPWGMDGIPEAFSSRACPRTSTISSRSSRPASAACRCWAGGHPPFFNGPESFTPDNRYFLGESADAAQPLRRLRLQFDRHPVLRRRRQGARRMDPRRPHADRPGRRRRAPRAPVPDQPQLPARPHQRVPGPALCHALAVPAVRDRARRAPLAVPRTAGRGRRLHGRACGLGAAQLVRRRRASSREYRYS